MPDPITVMSGLSAIKTALDITKTLADARDSSNLLAVKLELQGLLLEAQEAQSGLAGQKRELEERVRELEAWDGNQQRYELIEVAPGVVAFGLKADAEPPEAPHKLCASCFGQHQKGYLQSERRTPGMAEYLVCQRCCSELVVSGEVHPQHRGGPTQSRGRGAAFGR